MKTKELPLYSTAIKAGRPTFINTDIEKNIDLNIELIKNPNATFLVRVKGDSMNDAGIFSGDLLLVDKSLNTKEGDIVVAAINGEFTVKRLVKNEDKFVLHAENKNFKEIDIKETDDVIIWGVVIYSIKKFR